MTPSLIQFLIDSNNILLTSLEHMDQGDVHFYRVCALQLRLLLCDTTFRHNRIEDISLVSTIHREIAFHPLADNGTFDTTLKKIPLDIWLDQLLPDQNNPNVTIRNLIRSVCDQDGGAHIDPKPNASVHKIDDRETWIYLISKYIGKELESYIQNM